eukprot:jgi/Psemu1/291524/fgenesh1_pg.726_\
MVFLFRAHSHSVLGYANWLKCYIELNDPEEVIMNRHLVRVEDQPEEERVYLEIQPYASQRGDPWWASTSTDHDDLFPPFVYNSTAPTLAKIRLRVPPKLQHKDVQFVVEATTTTAGEGGGVLFPLSDRSVLLQIHRAAVAEADGRASGADQNQSTELFSSNNNIELVAGWAAGYEAVKLTPTMTILRRNSRGEEPATTEDNGNNDSNGSNEQDENNNIGGDGEL